MAITMAARILVPYVWGWWADCSGRPMRLVRLACLGTAGSFLGIYLAGGHLFGLALAMVPFSFFWSATLPLLETLTFRHLGNHAHEYSRIRVWGSIGFIVAAGLVGSGLAGVGLLLVPLSLLLLFALLWGTALTIPEYRYHTTTVEPASFATVLQRPVVIALFAICFLNQVGHGAYYAFFSIYLERLDYSGAVIGSLWSWAVLVEVGLFLLIPYLLPRYGARRLILVALLLTTVRWLLIAALAQSLTALIIAQALHSFSFGVHHAVAIYLIHQFFTGYHQSRGQALYSSLGFGAGSAVGSLAAGYLWGWVSADVIYSLAAWVTLLAGWIAWRYLRI